MTDVPVRDPGLQPERTTLSWSRTALVVAVNALLALRTGFVEGEDWLVVTGVVLIGAAAAVAGAGAVRRRQLDEGRYVPPVALVIAVSAVTVVAAAAGIASILGRGAP
ncbi:DUF202 domain-containing protein [Agromyces endophyticus]|uniref:DUF202 domain-containing protein n=1 Tax=Agromyces sp. H17E-10 TaxID=2932244 RepID=UPI001FD20786|nr:DUF202 domain-containing protein [Agromyces sp. H17E-10]UOQ88518.1 DUF202 domain-containing protein [Agromyces sp. H17E-10]